MVAALSPLGQRAKALDASASDLERMMELYVGNLPPKLQPDILAGFLNGVVLAAKATLGPGEPIERSWFHDEKGRHVIVALRSIEETNNLLGLDGTRCLGRKLKIGRPKSYPQKYESVEELHRSTLQRDVALFPEIAARPPWAGVADVGVVAAHSGDVLMLCGLPSDSLLPEAKLRSLLESFGSLANLDHIPVNTLECYGPSSSFIQGGGIVTAAGLEHLDKSGGIDGSVALVAFFQASHFQSCRDSLHGWSWSVRQRIQVVSGSELWNLLTDPPALLTASRAVSRRKARSQIFGLGQTALGVVGEKSQREVPLRLSEIPTRVLMIPGILTLSECGDNAKYTEMIADIDDEFRFCADVWGFHLGIQDEKLVMTDEEVRLWLPDEGNVVENDDGEGLPALVSPFGTNDSDAGHCFVEFSSVSEAMRVKTLFHGRKYNEKELRLHFFSEGLYNEKKFCNPSPLHSLRGSMLYNENLAKLYTERALEIERERIEEAILGKEVKEARTRRLTKVDLDIARVEAEAEVLAAEESQRRLGERDVAFSEMGISADSRVAIALEQATREGHLVRKESESSSMDESD